MMGLFWNSLLLSLAQVNERMFQVFLAQFSYDDERIDDDY